ncbi:hypothetical protein [Falsihalocynthiibacter arcticus]|nr:hypothetical protein [Falsihalocynthiibacter arcticus]
MRVHPRSNHLRLAATLAGLMLLVACATPQQRCINGATREYQTVANLAAQTELNIARGYAIDVSYVPYTVYETCYYGNRRAYACPQTYNRTVETPQTIDVAEQKRILADLKIKLSSLQEASAAWIAQCQAQYPE